MEIRFGPLWKESDVVKSWRKRYFVLTQKSFKFYSSEQAFLARSEEEASTLSLKDAEITLAPEKPREFAFKLTTAKRRLYLAADNERDLHGWLQDLKNFVRAEKEDLAYVPKARPFSTKTPQHLGNSDSLAKFKTQFPRLYSSIEQKQKRGNEDQDNFFVAMHGECSVERMVGGYEIGVQGTIFLTSQSVCFHNSMWNETVEIVIPFEDITFFDPTSETSLTIQVQPSTSSTSPATTTATPTATHIFNGIPEISEFHSLLCELRDSYLTAKRESKQKPLRKESVGLAIPTVGNGFLVGAGAAGGSVAGSVEFELVKSGAASWMAPSGSHFGGATPRARAGAVNLSMAPLAIGGGGGGAGGGGGTTSNGPNAVAASVGGSGLCVLEDWMAVKDDKKKPPAAPKVESPQEVPRFPDLMAKSKSASVVNHPPPIVIRSFRKTQFNTNAPRMEPGSLTPSVSPLSPVAQSSSTSEQPNVPEPLKISTPQETVLNLQVENQNLTEPTATCSNPEQPNVPEPQSDTKISTPHPETVLNPQVENQNLMIELGDDRQPTSNEPEQASVPDAAAEDHTNLDIQDSASPIKPNQNEAPSESECDQTQSRPLTPTSPTTQSIFEKDDIVYKDTLPSHEYQPSGLAMSLLGSCEPTPAVSSPVPVEQPQLAEGQKELNRLEENRDGDVVGGIHASSSPRGEENEPSKSEEERKRKVEIESSGCGVSHCGESPPRERECETPREGEGHVSIEEGEDETHATESDQDHDHNDESSHSENEDQHHDHETSTPQILISISKETEIQQQEGGGAIPIRGARSGITKDGGVGSVSMSYSQLSLFDDFRVEYKETSTRKDVEPLTHQKEQEKQPKKIRLRKKSKSITTTQQETNNKDKPNKKFAKSTQKSQKSTPSSSSQPEQPKLSQLQPSIATSKTFEDSDSDAEYITSEKMNNPISAATTANLLQPPTENSSSNRLLTDGSAMDVITHHTMSDNDYFSLSDQEDFQVADPGNSSARYHLKMERLLHLLDSYIVDYDEWLIQHQDQHSDQHKEEAERGGGVQMTPPIIADFSDFVAPRMIDLKTELRERKRMNRRLISAMQNCKKKQPPIATIRFFPNGGIEISDNGEISDKSESLLLTPQQFFELADSLDVGGEKSLIGEEIRKERFCDVFEKCAKELFFPERAEQVWRENVEKERKEKASATTPQRPLSDVELHLNHPKSKHVLQKRKDKFESVDGDSGSEGEAEDIYSISVKTPRGLGEGASGSSVERGRFKGEVGGSRDLEEKENDESETQEIMSTSPPSSLSPTSSPRDHQNFSTSTQKPEPESQPISQPQLQPQLPTNNVGTIHFSQIHYTLLDSSFKNIFSNNYMNLLPPKNFVLHVSLCYCIVAKASHEISSGGKKPPSSLFERKKRGVMLITNKLVAFCELNMDNHPPMTRLSDVLSQAVLDSRLGSFTFLRSITEIKKTKMMQVPMGDKRFNAFSLLFSDGESHILVCQEIDSTAAGGLSQPTNDVFEFKLLKFLLERTVFSQVVQACVAIQRMYRRWELKRYEMMRLGITPRAPLLIPTVSQPPAEVATAETFVETVALLPADVPLLIERDYGGNAAAQGYTLELPLCQQQQQQNPPMQDTTALVPLPLPVVQPPPQSAPRLSYMDQISESSYDEDDSYYDSSSDEEYLRKLPPPPPLPTDKFVSQPPAAFVDTTSEIQMEPLDSLPSARGLLSSLFSNLTTTTPRAVENSYDSDSGDDDHIQPPQAPASPSVYIDNIPTFSSAPQMVWNEAKRAWVEASSDSRSQNLTLQQQQQPQQPTLSVEDLFARDAAYLEPHELLRIFRVYKKEDSFGCLCENVKHYAVMNVLKCDKPGFFFRRTPVKIVIYRDFNSRQTNICMEEKEFVCEVRPLTEVAVIEDDDDDDQLFYVRFSDGTTWKLIAERWRPFAKFVSRIKWQLQAGMPGLY